MCNLNIVFDGLITRLNAMDMNVSITQMNCTQWDLEETLPSLLPHSICLWHIIPVPEKNILLTLKHWWLLNLGKNILTGIIIESVRLNVLSTDNDLKACLSTTEKNGVCVSLL